MGRWEIKEALEADKVFFKVRKNIIASFMQFVVEFETICARSFKPLPGSQSTAKEIINMYSTRLRNELDEEIKCIRPLKSIFHMFLKATGLVA